MEVNVDYVDTVRSYWITDPMTKWEISDCKLKTKQWEQCVVFPDGKIVCGVANPLKSGEKAIYLGHMLNIWGHCITDNLKKLWYLKTEEYRNLQAKGYTLCCTLQGSNKHFIQPFKTLLSYLDIDANDIHIISEDAYFEECIEPESSLKSNHQLHFEQKKIVDYIKKHINNKPSLPSKIYFSRVKFKNGRDFGEIYLENVFRQLGYSIIYPEQHSLEEQLEMLHSCDSFAATEGSISHNAMFCREDAEVIVIRKTRSCNGYQYSSNFIFGGKIIYIDAHLSILNVFDNAFGLFFMYVNDNVVNFAKSRGLTIKKRFPIGTFLKYILCTLWFALRYRQRPVLIGDSNFYYKRLKQDFWS